jgi:hypothetical protein
MLAASACASAAAAVAPMHAPPPRLAVQLSGQGNPHASGVGQSRAWACTTPQQQPAYSRRESLADLGEGPASRAVMIAQEVDELPLHTQLNSGGAIV